MSELESKRMKRDERRGGGRYNLRPSVPYILDAGTTQKRGNGSKINKKKCKKMETDCSNVISLLDLPKDLLGVITKRLSVVDYLSFGRVCKEWRSLFLESRREFLASQPPLALILPSRGRKRCVFFNMVRDERYETKLTCLAGKFCTGVSNGYLTMESPHDLWFANPATGHKLELNMVSPPFNTPIISDHTILAYAHPQQDYLVVLLSSYNYCVYIRHFRQAHWDIFSYIGKPWRLLDVTIFRGKIFVLTNECEIGILKLGSPCEVMLMQFKVKPRCGKFTRFVDSDDDELLVVDFSPRRWVEIYRIDFKAREWVRVMDLGNRALFLDGSKCVKVCDPRGWGGRTNCVYHLNSKSSWCYVYSIADGQIRCLIRIFEGWKENSPRALRGWYFPQEFYSLPQVWWDEQVLPMEGD